MIKEFFILWNILFAVSFTLLFFRSDAKLLIVELVDMLIAKDVMSFILSIFLIYTLFPFTIIHSLINIWRRF